MVVMNLRMFSIPRYSETSRHWLRESLQELLGCQKDTMDSIDIISLDGGSDFFNSIAQLCFHIDSIHSTLAEVECSTPSSSVRSCPNDDRCVSIKTPQCCHQKNWNSNPTCSRKRITSFPTETVTMVMTS